MTRLAATLLAPALLAPALLAPVLLAATAAAAAPPSLLPGTAYAYVADLSGPGPAAKVSLALRTAPDGQVAGQVVALGPDGRVVAGGPVTGHLSGQDCELRLALSAADPRRRGVVTEIMDGTCTPALVQGGVRVLHPETGLAAFFDWWGAGQGTGQFWLVSPS